MEHLKLIMEKLDLMNEEEKLNNGEYTFLMEHIGKAYNKKDIGKYVNIIQVKTKTIIFWKNKTASGFHTNNCWAYDECDEECECGECGDSSGLKTVEVCAKIERTNHTLKIIPDNDEYPTINITKNTIQHSAYEKIKEKKTEDYDDRMFVFICDVE